MTTSTRSSYDQTGSLDSAGSSDDIYDFSDVSYDDLSILKTELFHMMKRSETIPNVDHNNYLSQILAKHGTIPEEDDEEWYPPTPPPYDVLDKLIEANEFLDSDPTSSTHVAEKLRWRPDSRLVEIRWLGPKENSLSSISSNSEEIVILDTMNDLKLYDPSGSDSSMSSDLEQTKSLRSNLSSCKPINKINNNNNNNTDDNNPELSGSQNGESSGAEDSTFNGLTGATARNRNSSSTLSSSSGPKRVPAKISPNLSVSKSNKPLNSFTSHSTTTHHPTTGSSPYAQSQPTISKCPIPRQPPNQLKPTHRGTGSRCSSSASSTRSSSLDRRSQSANANTTTTTTIINNIKNNNYTNSSNKSHNHNRKASGNDKMSGSFSLPDLKGVANGSMIRANGSSSAQDQPSHISRVICRSRSPLPNPKRPILDKRKSDNFLRPPPTLQRKNSRNSLSSSSSTSSHSTGDDTNSDSSRREAADLAFEMWKQRKRQEKRLRERKVYLQSQQHRHLY